MPLEWLKCLRSAHEVRARLKRLCQNSTPAEPVFADLCQLNADAGEPGCHPNEPDRASTPRALMPLSSSQVN
jgi:hypothetical protein